MRRWSLAATAWALLCLGATPVLVEQHRIGLDDSLRKYFPDAPESWAPIRIKSLLAFAVLPDPDNR